MKNGDGSGGGGGGVLVRDERARAHFPEQQLVIESLVHHPPVLSSRQGT